MARIRLVLSLVALATVVMCAPNAMAQRPGGGGPGRGGFGGGFGGFSPMMLVGMEPIQKELGLKEDQVAKLKTLGEESRKEMQGGGGGGQSFQNLSDDERRKLIEERTEAARKLNEKYKPKVAEILDAKQNERLKQIQLQVAGARIYQDPEVIKALDLSKEQQEKLAATNKEYEDKRNELFRAAFGGGAGAGGGDVREKGRELSEANDKKLAEVLSKDQVGKLEKLKGAKFDVAQLRGGFGGPGGPGGGGRPGAEGRPRRTNSGDKKADEKKSDK